MKKSLKRNMMDRMIKRMGGIPMASVLMGPVPAFWELVPVSSQTAIDVHGVTITVKYEIRETGKQEGRR